jgi:hypothetical protein
MTKLYVASSWRNPIYEGILAKLKDAGHDCYDFKNPKVNNNGFAWSQIDKDWLNWSPEKFTLILQSHPIARAGFNLDKEALDWSEATVLVLPCGKSAHLEAGYAAGQGKPVHVLLSKDRFEPELMYLLCSSIHTDVDVMIEHMKINEQYGTDGLGRLLVD